MENVNIDLSEFNCYTLQMVLYSFEYNNRDKQCCKISSISFKKFYFHHQL